MDIKRIIIPLILPIILVNFLGFFTLSCFVQTISRVETLIAFIGIDITSVLGVQRAIRVDGKISVPTTTIILFVFISLFKLC